MELAKAKFRSCNFRYAKKSPLAQAARLIVYAERRKARAEVGTSPVSDAYHARERQAAAIYPRLEALIPKPSRQNPFDKILDYGRDPSLAAQATTEKIIAWQRSIARFADRLLALYPGIPAVAEQIRGERIEAEFLAKKAQLKERVRQIGGEEAAANHDLLEYLEKDLPDKRFELNDSLSTSLFVYEIFCAGTEPLITTQAFIELCREINAKCTRDHASYANCFNHIGRIIAITQSPRDAYDLIAALIRLPRAPDFLMILPLIVRGLESAKLGVIQTDWHPTKWR